MWIMDSIDVNSGLQNLQKRHLRARAGPWASEPSQELIVSNLPTSCTVLAFKISFVSSINELDLTFYGKWMCFSHVENPVVDWVSRLASVTMIIWTDLSSDCRNYSWGQATGSLTPALLPVRSAGLGESQRRDLLKFTTWQHSNI